MVDQVCQALGVSQRRACSVIGQPRSTQRRAPKIPDDEVQLTAAIIDLARQYGRYGYRRITDLLQQVGLSMGVELPAIMGLQFSLPDGGWTR